MRVFTITDKQYDELRNDGALTLTRGGKSYMIVRSKRGAYSYSQVITSSAGFRFGKDYPCQVLTK